MCKIRYAGKLLYIRNQNFKRRKPMLINQLLRIGGNHGRMLKIKIVVQSESNAEYQKKDEPAIEKGRRVKSGKNEAKQKNDPAGDGQGFM